MATYRAILQSPHQIPVVMANGPVRVVQGFDEIFEGKPLEDRHSIVKDHNALWKTKCLQD